MTDVRTLAPDRLLRVLRTRQYRYSLPRAVGLQLMHPAISAGLLEHSPAPNHIWLHKAKAVPAMIDSAFVPDGDPDTRYRIRYAHEHVRGIDHRGDRYHALNPRVFAFQHATYVEALLFTIDRYLGPVPPEQRAALYRETVRWYRAYGISDAPVPREYDGFVEYFAAETAELIATPALGRYRGQLLRPRQWTPRTVPAAVIRAHLHPVTLAELGTAPSRADRRLAAAFTRVHRIRAKTSAGDGKSAQAPRNSENTC